MTTDGQQISFDTTEKLTLSDVGAKSNGTTPVQKPVTQSEQPSKPVAELMLGIKIPKYSIVLHALLFLE